MTPTTPPQPESKTPRTDGFYWKSTGIAPVGRGSSEWADFARQLETELNEANNSAELAKKIAAELFDIVEGIHPKHDVVAKLKGGSEYVHVSQLTTALKERDEAREEMILVRPKADCYDRVCMALKITNDIFGHVKSIKQNRDNWKQIAEDSKGFLIHKATCGIWTSHNSNVCTCGLTALRERFEQMKKGN